MIMYPTFMNNNNNIIVRLIASVHPVTIANQLAAMGSCVIAMRVGGYKFALNI